MKKILKLKCQEDQNLIPGQNQDMGRYGVGNDAGQVMTMMNYSQPSKNLPFYI